MAIMREGILLCPLKPHETECMGSRCAVWVPWGSHTVLPGYGDEPPPRDTYGNCGLQEGAGIYKVVFPNSAKVR